MKNLRFVFFKISLLLILASLLIVTRVQADALDQWTTTFSQTNSFRISGLAYGNNMFVAVALYPFSDFGVILSSTDGKNWIQRTTNTQTSSTYELHDVTFGNGTFVAVGYTGSIYTSTNGIEWQNTQLGPIWNFNGVTYGNGKFVAVGDCNLISLPGSVSTTSSNIYTSSDGFTWVPQRSFPIASAAKNIYAVTFGEGSFKAVGEGGYYYSSTDGIIWTRGALSSSDLSDVAYGHGVMITSDSSTNSLSNTDVQLSSITCVNGTFVGSGYDLGFNTNSIVFSQNGTIWKKSNFHPPDGIRAMTFDGSRFAGFGTINLGNSQNQILRSSFYLSDPVVSMGVQPGSAPGINLAGLVGRSYQIQCLNAGPANGSNSWQVLTNFTLPSSPYIWTDTSATNSPQRFYRAVLLP